MALTKEQILTLTCLKEVGVKGVGLQKIFAIGAVIDDRGLEIKSYEDLAQRAKEEERKRLEAEEARRKAEEQAEKKKKEEQIARLKVHAPSVFSKNVKDWEYLYADFYYTWLFYYYPTTCDFDANEEEWDNRYMVWNFKNDPEKHISSQDHENILEEIIPQIKQKLTYTFGEEYLQFLTLFCLPASMAQNTSRFEKCHAE